MPVNVKGPDANGPAGEGDVRIVNLAWVIHAVNGRVVDDAGPRAADAAGSQEPRMYRKRSSTSSQRCWQLSPRARQSQVALQINPGMN